MIFIYILYSQWTLIKSLLHWIKIWHTVWFLSYYILKVTKLYWRKLYQWLLVVMFGEKVWLQKVNTTESCSDGNCSVFWLWHLLRKSMYQLSSMNCTLEIINLWYRINNQIVQYSISSWLYLLLFRSLIFISISRSKNNLKISEKYERDRIMIFEANTIIENLWSQIVTCSILKCLCVLYVCVHVCIGVQR